jgi:hypothetical protein
MGMYRVPRRVATVCALTAAFCAWAHSSDAFELKYTSHGLPLRWDESQVAYVVDPSIEQNVPGGAKAASSAVAGWSASAGGPTLATSVGGGGAKAGLDGQNSILFAPHGFAPAGSALAITVVSYDDATGDIIDADLVVNGTYSFAVLAASAMPADNASPVSTDGAPTSHESHQKSPFDLFHVLAHETGHSLGLADEPIDQLAVMYGFTDPGDASARDPTIDDVDGVDAIYGAVPAATQEASHSGCAVSAVAGSRTRPLDALAAFALVAAAGMWVASRRLAKTRRAMVPIGAAFLAFAAIAVPVHSAPAVPVLLADASARVVAVTTTNVDGLFETMVDLAPTACRTAPCPSHAKAHAWGGSVGGITQRIGAADPLPGVGDVVDIAFSDPVEGADPSTESDVRSAALVARHH